MARKPVPLTEEELDMMAQDEVNRLQRQYRIMAADREAYSDEVKAILIKQKQVIEQLEKEKAEIMVNLKLTLDPNNKKKDDKNEAAIKELLRENEELTQNVKHEGKELKELEDALYNVKMEIYDIKTKHSLQDSNIEQIRRQDKIDENLQNKLHVSTTRYNEMSAENNKLRTEIDHMLKERGRFNTMFNNLLNKLSAGKKIIMDLIEQSTLAYIRRDEAYQTLEALRARAKHDLIQHSAEMRELRRKLDHDTKLHEFVGIKGQKRCNVDLATMEYLKKLKEKEATELLMVTYKEMIEQMKEMFNEPNIGRLASQFLKREEDNFNIFSFINELNKEAQSIREELTDLRYKILEQREINKKREEEQKASILSLEEELEIKTKKSDEAEKKLEESKVVVKQLLEGIETVFKFIQCDSSPILKLLGENAHVTIYNGFLFLGILEKRVTDLADLIYYLQKTRAAVKAAKLFPGQVSILKEKLMVDEVKRPKPLAAAEDYILTQPCPLCHEAEEISEVDETIAVPILLDDAIDCVKTQMLQPEYCERLHNVSACRLPKSRKIIQRRYQ